MLKIPPRFVFFIHLSSYLNFVYNRNCHKKGVTSCNVFGEMCVL